MSEHEPLGKLTVLVVEKYRDQFTNTGGNDPLELLLDLQPYTNGRDNRLMTTNIVRFVLAVGIQAQVGLIRSLIDAGKLPSLDDDGSTTATLKKALTTAEAIA